MKPSHHQTAPKDRVPLFQKSFMAWTFKPVCRRGDGSAGPPGSNLGLGVNPALVGAIGAFPRMLDAFSDPSIGYASDQTRTRWGRRKPWISLKIWGIFTRLDVPSL